MGNITIIPVGTRGDAQPAIALGKGLNAAGHHTASSACNVTTPCRAPQPC